MALRTRLVVAFLAVAGGPVALAAAYLRGAVLGAMAALAVLLAVTAAAWLWRSHQSHHAHQAQPYQPYQSQQSQQSQQPADPDQQRQHLTVLGDTLASSHDLDRMLAMILRTALAVTGAQAAAMLLLDAATGTLAGHRAVAGSEQTEPTTVPLGEGLLGGVAATGEPRRGSTGRDGTYLVVPISAPPLPPYPRDPHERAPRLAGAPWPAPPTVRGVLALYDRPGGAEFDADDLATLRTFARQAAVAVDNVRLHQEAQRLSLTDPLTGLWNYRYLKESLRREVERASRFNHHLAVLALDLDRFKEVNDLYGHPAGDEVLVEFADRITRASREIDLAFRYGGEEFVVLLPETDTSGATVLAKRLGAAVRGEPVMLPPPVEITVSIGIAVYPEHAGSPPDLLDAADEALYAAKAAGRDTFQVATARPAAASAELPVRSGARSPDGDLPQAGNSQPPHTGTPVQRQSPDG